MAPVKYCDISSAPLTHSNVPITLQHVTGNHMEAHGGERTKKMLPSFCTHVLQGGPSRHRGTSILTVTFEGVEWENVMKYEPHEI